MYQFVRVRLFENARQDIKTYLEMLSDWDGKDIAALIVGILSFLGIIAGLSGLIIADMCELDWKWCGFTAIVSAVFFVFNLIGKGMDCLCSGF